MAKLSLLKPRLEGASSRVGQSPRDERERDLHRSTSNAWRSWYKTARWQKLRLRIIERDVYTCQRTGIILVGKHPAPDSPVVDHITPHRGNEALFWDETNLHTVSKAYHDRLKQVEEQSAIKGVWY
ncbi:HNH endonuclease [Mesorhizobium sp. CAU 1741]|uniref:HNH endonuclease n=1 Tax=Mesorhizobium sp. CAU 1741 TaxID=3140366 RepID=UPI00325BA5E3